MKIGLLGDTHMSTPWMEFALNEFYRRGIDTILQVGDFGIWPGAAGKEFLTATNRWLDMFDQTMYVTPGNHEDYDQIKNWESQQGSGLIWPRPHIALFPRGFRWEWDGMSFVSLGGAPSIDRTTRLRRKSGWWAAEMITDEDVAKVAEGGYADVMVCHDAPHVPGLDRRLAEQPSGFMKIDRDYAYDGRVLMQKAFVAVQPKIFLHGHYHQPVSEQVGQTHILGLAKDYQNYSLGVLDTTTRQAGLLDIKKQYEAYHDRLSEGQATS